MVSAACAGRMAGMARPDAASSRLRRLIDDECNPVLLRDIVRFPPPCQQIYVLV
jgi:hypothetical protein